MATMYLDFRRIAILKMGWPKQSKDMDYPLWTRLYMVVVGVTNPKDETFYLVTLISSIVMQITGRYLPILCETPLSVCPVTRVVISH